MAKVEQLELRRTMRSIVVPVIDSEVRALLRQMGEPITLFGEREVSRELFYEGPFWCMIFVEWPSTASTNICLLMCPNALQMERRERLRKLLATMNDDQAEALGTKWSCEVVDYFIL